ncbi:MAG: trigger factor, partial [Acidimicrobiaceae bacterium]
SAPHPVEGREDIDFEVEIKGVKERVLPEVTDEWANDVSEFETVDELRTDISDRITKVRKIQAQMAVREKAATVLVELVDAEVPDALVGAELQQRLQDFALRLNAQGVSPEQYFEATGQSQAALVEELRELAVQGVKADLALRAVADAESIEATDEDVDEEIERLAQRLDQKATKLRQDLERADQIPAVRSDIRKRKALDWLVEHVELVDEQGEPIERAALELPADDNDEQEDE